MNNFSSPKKNSIKLTAWEIRYVLDNREAYYECNSNPSKKKNKMNSYCLPRKLLTKVTLEASCIIKSR